MSEMDCVSTFHLKFVHTHPLTRNHKGSLIQQPSFTIRADGDEYHFFGRDVMWSFLDALFPDDPLPRNALEDDLFAPVMGTDSMYSIFNDLTREAYEEGNQYLILHHEDNKVMMVSSLNSLGLSSDIETAGGVLSYLVREDSAEYVPFKYRSKKGVNLRPSAYIYVKKCKIQVIDLGLTWYLRAIGADTQGGNVGIIPPTTYQKKDKVAFAIGCQGAVDAAIAYTPIDTLLMQVSPSSLLTREYDVLLYDRKTKGML